MGGEIGRERSRGEARAGQPERQQRRRQAAAEERRATGSDQAIGGIGREIADRAAVMPAGAQGAEQVAGIQDAVRLPALAEDVRLEVLEVPQELEVDVVEDAVRAHAQLGGEDAERDAAVLELLVDVLDREVDGVDLVQHAEQIGTAPDDLLAADAEDDLLLPGQRDGCVHVQLAQPAVVVAELRQTQIVLVEIQVVVDTAALVDVARAHRVGELHAAESGRGARTGERFLADDEHTVVGIGPRDQTAGNGAESGGRTESRGARRAGHGEVARQRHTAAPRHAGRQDARPDVRAAEVLQHHRPAGVLAPVVLVEVIGAVVGGAQDAVQRQLREDARTAEVLGELELAAETLFRDPRMLAEALVRGAVQEAARFERAVLRRPRLRGPDAAGTPRQRYHRRGEQRMPPRLEPCRFLSCHDFPLNKRPIQGLVTC